jgi:hypothetical protein
LFSFLFAASTKEQLNQHLFSPHKTARLQVSARDKRWLAVWHSRTAWNTVSKPSKDLLDNVKDDTLSGEEKKKDAR